MKKTSWEKFFQFGGDYICKPLVSKRIGMATVDGVFPPIKAYNLMKVQDGKSCGRGGVDDFIYIVLQNMAVEVSLRRVMFG